MKAVAQFQLHVDRFARWHALLAAFDLAVALAALWNVWLWRGQPEVATMGGLSLAVFLMVLAAQYPYWKIGPYTLIHGGAGWKLMRERRLHALAEVRGLPLPGQLLVLALCDEGRVVLPVSAAIAPQAWRELRMRLAL